MTDRAQTHDGYQRLREFLTNAVKEGAYAPGSRLPTERRLAEQFGVTRAMTRNALAELEAAKLIRRHVGRGTFVEQPADVVRGTPFCLPEESISPADYIETRLRFEPELAWMIVSGATAADFERMQSLLAKGEQASTREEYELADAASAVNALLAGGFRARGVSPRPLAGAAAAHEALAAGTVHGKIVLVP